MKICPNCGSQNPEENQVCEQCQIAFDTAVQKEQDPAKNPKQNKKKIILLISIGCAALIVFIILIFTHTICILHEWQDATCTEPKTCTYCGQTEGGRSRHRGRCI